MKSKAVAAAVVALSSLLMGAGAHAQMEGDGNEKNPRAPSGAVPSRPAPVDPVARQGQRNESRALALQQRGRANDDRRRNEPGAGPDHQFRRGDRLPEQYRSRQYVVDDWRGHHLKQPPRGYHWVQTGGDYVLAAIATGVIAELLLDR